MKLFSKLLLFIALLIFSNSYSKANEKIAEVAKTEKFKKQKIKKEAFPDGSFSYTHKPEWYKSDDGIETKLGFKLKINRDENGNIQEIPIIYLEIYCYSTKTYPKGVEMLIRTGSDKVYKAVTLQDFTNEASTTATYGQTNGINTPYVVTGTTTSHSDLKPEFVLPPDALEDIFENGIKKIRKISAPEDGKFTPWDYDFTGESFKKFHKKIRDIYMSIEEKSKPDVEILKNTKPIEIPEF